MGNFVFWHYDDIEPRSNLYSELVVFLCGFLFCGTFWVCFVIFIVHSAPPVLRDAWYWCNWSKWIEQFIFVKDR